MEGSNMTRQESDKAISVTPNQAMLDTLVEIAKRQEGRETTSGEDTQRLLREARSGGMYGYEPSEDSVSAE